MKINASILAAILPLLLVAGAQSQDYDNVRGRTTDRDTGQASRYLLGDEENLLFSVNILGMVDKPGQYMLPYKTDLVTLIAYAGGFRENAKISEVKVIRLVASNGRNGANGRNNGIIEKRVVYKVDVKKYFDEGDTRQVPQLMPDDTIVVTGSTTHTINRVFDFVSKGVMLAQLYFFIKVAND